MKIALVQLLLIGCIDLSQAVQIGTQSGAANFMKMKSKASVEALVQSKSKTQQQSHNCNFNLDRLKKGPVDWTKIEGSGKMFTDHSFPADETMLSWKEYPRTVGGLGKYLSWFKDFKRPRDFFAKTKDTNSQMVHPSLFGKNFESTGKLAAYDLEQGSVGDNYFLTVVAALADRGNFIPKMFNQKKYNNEGIFTVTVYVKGRPEDITIDDYFPVYSHTPAFAKPSVDGGWWLPLIEKAYAKANVNYEMLTTGSQSEAGQFLTGSPARDFKSNQEEEDETWIRLTQALSNKYLVTAACFIDNNGLVGGNGYIVKSFIKSGDQRLVKVKNPWKTIGDPSYKESSHGDWTGKFNKQDHANLSEEIKQKAGKLGQGEFIMSVEDFRVGFKYYTITYMHDTWKNSFIEKRSSVGKRLYKFNFTISEDDYVEEEHVDLGADFFEPTVHNAQQSSESIEEAPVSTIQKTLKPVIAQPKEAHHAKQSNINQQIVAQKSPPNGSHALLDIDLPPPSNNSNLQVEDKLDEGTHENEILKNLQQHLIEGQETLLKLAQKGSQGWNPALEKASTMEDAMDIMLQSDVHFGADGDKNLLESEEDASDEERDLEMRKSQTDVQTSDGQNTQQQQQQQPIANTVEVSEDKKPKGGNPLTSKPKSKGSGSNLTAYVGASLYYKRMFPHGCPSYQKAFVKLFRVEQGPKGGEVLKLVDSRFFTNRDGFGFIKKDLKVGKYQIHVKKYSSAFDVFDFTARIYAPRNVKIIDDDDEALNKIQLSKEVIAKIPSIHDHIKSENAKEDKEAEPKAKLIKKKKEAAEASDAKPAPPKDVQPKDLPIRKPDAPVAPVAPAATSAPVAPAATSAPVALPKESATTQTPPLVAPVEKQNPQQNQKNKESLVQQQTVSEETQQMFSTKKTSAKISKKIMAEKLHKAIALADNNKNDKFFEIHQRDFYYMKDAMDKKHGFYYLRIGSDSNDHDLSLKVKMFLKGDQLETTEDKEKLYVYKFPEDKPEGSDFKLTTYCNIRPEQGKKHCDFLVPTEHHDKTYVYVQKKLDVPQGGAQKPVDEAALAPVVLKDDSQKI